MICQARPDMDFFLAPTTTRVKPIWFADAQATISRLILAEVQDLRVRLLLLPAFYTEPASMDPDGIHFLPSIGVKYCIHLIDSAR